MQVTEASGSPYFSTCPAICPAPLPTSRTRFAPRRSNLPRAEDPLAQRNVQRHHAAHREQGALRAAVDPLDLVAVLVVADPADQIVLDQPVQRLPCGPLGSEPRTA